ncbi:unnamed protein product [Caenorhabditis nigoni]
MLPKTNLVQYLAAYQQQLLARFGIILLPPNCCKVQVFEQLGDQSISSSRPMRYEIPPAAPKPVEGVPDLQDGFGQRILESAYMEGYGGLERWKFVTSKRNQRSCQYPGTQKK